MNNNFWKKVLQNGGVVFFVTIAFFAGLYVDAKKEDITYTLASIGGTKTTAESKTDLTSFWKVWKILDERYVPTKTATTSTDSEKVYGAIKGMVDSLQDPYTTFFDPEESKDFADELSGSLEGVGIVLGLKDEKLIVVSPLKGSPAAKAGVLEGDIILKINNTDTTSKFTIEEAVKLIRGAKGTKVTLTLQRSGKTAPIVVTITRATIEIPIVETKIVGNETVFVIEIHSFTANANGLFRTALKEFTESGKTKLIIDLRNNPGGYLESAVDIASWFVETGKTVVTEDFGGKKENIVYRSKGYTGLPKGTKVAVLINEGSASASEILAGALQEYNKATLVGSKTFGKGSVQELITIDDTTSLKVTIARWLTPKGVNLSNGGLEPKYNVKNTDEDRKAGTDRELNKAIEILKGK